MIYIGIDPGKSGGIAVSYRTPDGWLDDVAIYNMPATPADLLHLLERYDPRRDGAREPGGNATRAVLERVNAGVWGHVAGGKAKRGQMGVSSAFTFGRGYGWIEMALLAARIPFDLVMPITWQTALGCRTHGDKNITKARAQALFPAFKVTHAIADALLIMKYAHYLDTTGGKAATTQEGRDGKEGHEEKVRKAGEGQAGEGRAEGSRKAGARSSSSRTAQSVAPRHGAGSQRQTRQPV